MSRRALLPLLLAVIAVSLLWGMLAQRNHWPPYSLVKGAFDLISPPPGGGHLRPDPDLVEAIDPRYRKVDVASLLHACTADAVDSLRAGLTTFLFGEDRLPTGLPEPVDASGGNSALGSGVKAWRVEMEFGLTSIVYDVGGPGPVVLYHQGHGEPLDQSAWLVERLVDAGCRVLVLAMPLEGRNPPLLHGGLEIASHAQLAWLEPSAGHPARFLIEPVVVMLNQLEVEGARIPVTMVGLSGGGWTTTLAAALDLRLGVSVPVAGSLPLWLRSGVAGDWGDWEQTLPALYRRWTYPDLYVLGSSGLDRAQVQVLNQYDPVCFAGIRSQLYESAVRDCVAAAGAGEFRVFVDGTHARHAISPAAANLVLELVGK
jgi:hypothetical protein